jgi:hypothetical protein
MTSAASLQPDTAGLLAGLAVVTLGVFARKGKWLEVVGLLGLLAVGVYAFSQPSGGLAGDTGALLAVGGLAALIGGGLAVKWAREQAAENGAETCGLVALFVLAVVILAAAYLLGGA